MPSSGAGPCCPDRSVHHKGFSRAPRLTLLRLETADSTKQLAAAWLYVRPMTDMLTHTDIVSDGWIDRRMPGWTRPYLKLARLDRPTGIWLLLLPCWWAIALASPTAPTGIGMTVLFTIGAIVMRGAGCTVNDIIDRKIDAQVERTK